MKPIKIGPGCSKMTKTFTTIKMYQTFYHDWSPCGLKMLSSVEQKLPDTLNDKIDFHGKWEVGKNGAQIDSEKKKVNEAIIKEIWKYKRQNWK